MVCNTFCWFHTLTLKVCWKNLSLFSINKILSKWTGLLAVSELEKLFGRLWTQCQECQGSLHQDVLCTRWSFTFAFTSFPSPMEYFNTIVRGWNRLLPEPSIACDVLYMLVQWCPIDGLSSWTHSTCFVLPLMWFLFVLAVCFVSRDCPIFYRRKKAQKDMAEAKVQLDRWSF